jgi:hypothetical protein
VVSNGNETRAAQNVGGVCRLAEAFLDRGERTNSSNGVMCVVCTVFKEGRYKQFARPWDRMIKRWGASNSGGGEFARDRSRGTAQSFAVNYETRGWENHAK